MHASDAGAAFACSLLGRVGRAFPRGRTDGEVHPLMHDDKGGAHRFQKKKGGAHR